MRTVPDWNTYFMAIAKTYAIRCKNPGVQVGCVIVELESRSIRSGGYCGMVAGIDERPEHWNDRALKHKFACHAESNAIALAARNGVGVAGCWLYCTNAPCLACARLIVQAGIVAAVYPMNSVTTLYRDEAQEARALLFEAKLRVIEIV